MTTTTATDTSAELFMRIDQLVYVLEQEGYPFNAICQEMRDYLDIIEEYSL